MTKTEIALQKKVDKDECKEKHTDFEKYFDEKIDSLKTLIEEKLKGMSWFNLVHLLGYISIVLALIGILMKTK